MNQVRLFVYGMMMSGQRDHSVVEAAKLVGRIQTEPRYTLVDIDVYAALIVDGRTSIHGELYLVDPIHLALIDRARQVPHLFRRSAITLSDGTLAETHFLTMEQVRGKRRLGHGNWLERFAPRSVPHRALPFAAFARQRTTKR